MNSRLLRRLLVSMVMMIGIAAGDAGQARPSALGQQRSDRPPAATAVTAQGWSPDGVMPGQLRVAVAAGSERGVRIKAPVLVGGVATLALAVVVASRGRFRRHRGPSLPLALRARSVPRRAPPLLPLG